MGRGGAVRDGFVGGVVRLRALPHRTGPPRPTNPHPAPVPSSSPSLQKKKISGIVVGPVGAVNHCALVDLVSHRAVIQAPEGNHAHACPTDRRDAVGAGLSSGASASTGPRANRAGARTVPAREPSHARANSSVRKLSRAQTAPCEPHLVCCARLRIAAAPAPVRACAPRCAERR